MFPAYIDQHLDARLPQRVSKTSLLQAWARSEGHTEWKQPSLQHVKLGHCVLFHDKQSAAVASFLNAAKLLGCCLTQVSA